MSVVVLGMEMPTGCADCETKYGFTRNHEDGTTWCRVAKGYIGDKRTVCPLRPLPKEHGRLVDVDKLEAEGYALSKLHIDNNTGNAWREAIPFDEAQTVIEAEGQNPSSELEPVDVVPWSFLERYADWFCAMGSFPEFIFEAKRFYLDSIRAMDGGVIDG